MTHYKVKCPHCKAVLRYTKTASGSPFGTCPKCGQPYVDRECYEPALKPYKKETTASLLASSVFVGSLFSFMPLAFYYICSAARGFSGAKALIVYAVAFCIITGYIFIRMNKSRDEDDARALKEWEASDARLQNKEYALAVKKLGFDVPDKYLTQNTGEKE